MFDYVVSWNRWCLVFSSLLAYQEKRTFLMTIANWKRVVVGVVQVKKYLHSHEKGAILHNYLKCDNVIVANSTGKIKPCIIDFGKACLESNPKLYHLSMPDKDVYRKHHPQVAPDVRDGLYKQSTASDIRTPVPLLHRSDLNLGSLGIRSTRRSFWADVLSG